MISIEYLKRILKLSIWGNPKCFLQPWTLDSYTYKVYTKCILNILIHESVNSFSNVQTKFINLFHSLSLILIRLVVKYIYISIHPLSIGCRLERRSLGMPFSYDTPWIPQTSPNYSMVEGQNSPSHMYCPKQKLASSWISITSSVTGFPTWWESPPYLCLCMTISLSKIVAPFKVMSPF